MAPSRVWCVKAKPSQMGPGNTSKGKGAVSTGITGQSKMADKAHSMHFTLPYRTEDDRETCPGSEDGTSSSGDESWSPGSPVEKQNRTKLSGNAAPFVPAAAKLSIDAPVFTPMATAALMEGIMPPSPAMPPLLQVIGPQEFSPAQCMVSCEVAPGMSPFNQPQWQLPEPMPQSPLNGEAKPFELPAIHQTQWPLPEACTLSPVHQPLWQLPASTPEFLPEAVQTNACHSQWALPEPVPEFVPGRAQPENGKEVMPAAPAKTSPSSPAQKSTPDLPKKMSWADIDDDDDFESPWNA